MTDPRKPIFDAVRAAAPAGLFNDPGNVLALDNLMDAFGVARAALERTTGAAGLSLIKMFEGLRLRAYDDGVGVWTIGYGHTAGVKPGDVITEAKADAFLRDDLAEAERAVRQYCPVTTANQFDALVSFTFNLGAGALKDSTLRRKHNEGDYGGAKVAFASWNKGRVNGVLVPMAGLTKRRAAEAKLYGGT